MKESGPRKVFNMIVAVVLSIALWAYCVIEVNPTSTKVFKNIPIIYEGELDLEEDGLTIVSDLTSSVNVTLAGQRSRLDQLKSSSVAVICNLSDLEAGEHRASLNIVIPEGTTLEAQSIKTVLVNIENIITESRPIIGVIINQDADSDIAKILSISKEKVKISGAESYVKAVSYVRTTVDATQLGNEVAVIETSLEPVDKDGNVIEGITLGRASVTCRAVLVNEEEAASESDITSSDSDINSDEQIGEPSEGDEAQEGEQAEGEGQGEGHNPESETENEGETDENSAHESHDAYETLLNKN